MYNAIDIQPLEWHHPNSLNRCLSDKLLEKVTTDPHQIKRTPEVYSGASIWNLCMREGARPPQEIQYQDPLAFASHLGIPPVGLHSFINSKIPLVKNKKLNGTYSTVIDLETLHDYKFPENIHFLNRDWTNLAIKAFMGLAYERVNTICGDAPTQFRDDVLSDANLALWKCLEKYDFSKGMSPKNFVSLIMKWNISDSIRNNKSLSGSRNDQRMLKEMHRFKHHYRNTNGCDPDVLEMLQELGISERTYEKLMMRISTRPMELDMMIEEGFDLPVEGIHESVPHMNRNMDAPRLWSDMHASVAKLKTKPQQVLNMLYIDEFTLKEVGKVLNLTEGRISQIHTKAKEKLKKRLREWSDFYHNN